MARCMAKTKEGKRCGNKSVEWQVYCATHLNGKTRLGKSRKLTTVKCQKMRRSHKSPISQKHVKSHGKTYGQLYTACRPRMMDLAKRIKGHPEIKKKYPTLGRDLKSDWRRNRFSPVKKTSPKKK